VHGIYEYLRIHFSPSDVFLELAVKKGKQKQLLLKNLWKSSN
jgi:hypothetical protein